MLPQLQKYGPLFLLLLQGASVEAQQNSYRDVRGNTNSGDHSYYDNNHRGSYNGGSWAGPGNANAGHGTPSRFQQGRSGRSGHEDPRHNGMDMSRGPGGYGRGVNGNNGGRRGRHHHHRPTSAGGWRGSRTGPYDPLSTNPTGTYPWGPTSSDGGSIPYGNDDSAPYPWAPLSTDPASGPYNFDPRAKNNVAVYFGQTPASSTSSLMDQCSDPAIDIVILGFVSKLVGANDYPELNLGSVCTDKSPDQTSRAPGLLNCPDLASHISHCQDMGKKVFLSIGGAKDSGNSDSKFDSDDHARSVADKIWKLFGSGSGEESLRPFGNVTVDGFDIGLSILPDAIQKQSTNSFSPDNESKDSSHYDIFFNELKSQFTSYASSSGGKKYYLSAAPECPNPDASIPQSVLQAADFVFVQFFNNPDCNIDAAGFQASVTSWSQSLANNNPNGAGPMVYIGVVATSQGASSGFVAGDKLGQAVNGVKAMNLPNIGGVAIWDATEALDEASRDGEYDVIHSAKVALGVTGSNSKSRRVRRAVPALH
ncbi:MAG: hypothetical protein M1829_001253 [Trizodia sp. TS-e1964]|nr:MAG: hypothetical protein M1829_001253 [Trizodia sp. TS-e1964]